MASKAVACIVLVGGLTIIILTIGIFMVYPSSNQSAFGALSEENTKIVFTDYADRSEGSIYVMNADGSGQTRLTSSGDANRSTDYRPDWSPDGTKIAFTSYRDGNFEIYVMNADGSGQTNISNNPAYDFDPSWSPDGTKIAFTSYRDDNFEIYDMIADDSGQTNISNNPDYDFVSDW